MLKRPIRAVRGESSQQCIVGRCVNCGAPRSWLLPTSHICLGCDLAEPAEFQRRYETMATRKETHA